MLNLIIEKGVITRLECQKRIGSRQQFTFCRKNLGELNHADLTSLVFELHEILKPI
jgi:hypothetical protein